MPFTPDELRAGRELAERALARAESALANARTRSERKRAAAEVEQARGALAAGDVMLRKAEKQHDVDTALAASMPGPAAPALPARDVLAAVREFGRLCREDGEEFDEVRGLPPGHFFHTTGRTRIGIMLWSGGDRWTLSMFSAARIRMRPTLELYRYVARWRASCSVAAPYIVEADAGAAVLCEAGLHQFQLADLTAARRLIASSIDLVGDTARRIGADLADADGIPFTVDGPAGLTLLSSWWEIQDPRINRLLAEP